MQLPYYNISKPVPILQPFVDILWFYDSYIPSSRAERILPTGTAELVINVHGGLLRVADGHAPQCFRSFRGAVVCGPHTHGFVIDTSQPSTLLGIQFKPGGAFPFFSLPVQELHNQHVLLTDLWGSVTSDLLEQVSMAATPQAAFCSVEQIMLAQAVRPLALHPAVIFALNVLQSGSHPSIASISEQIGLSARYFGHLFREQVGLTPKRFSRVQRFQTVLNHIHTAQQVHWADMALECGYFDQAHFVHDFRAFSGLTPSRYLEQRTSHRNHISLKH